MGYELRLRRNIYVYPARWEVGIHSFMGTHCRGVFQFADINRMIMNVVIKRLWELHRNVEYKLSLLCRVYYIHKMWDL